MYEMCAGHEEHGGTLVWHVMAKRSSEPLCGRRFIRAADAASAERAGHCPACMASFMKLMTAPPDAESPAGTPR